MKTEEIIHELNQIAGPTKVLSETKNFVLVECEHPFNLTLDHIQHLYDNGFNFRHIVGQQLMLEKQVVTL